MVKRRVPWWLHLPMQETWVWSLILEDLTSCGAAKPVCHNYWSLRAPQPSLHKRSHCSEKAKRHNWRIGPTPITKKSPAAMKTQHTQKQNKIFSQSQWNQKLVLKKKKKIKKTESPESRQTQKRDREDCNY